MWTTAERTELLLKVLVVARDRKCCRRNSMYNDCSLTGASFHHETLSTHCYFIDRMTGMAKEISPTETATIRAAEPAAILKNSSDTVVKHFKVYRASSFSIFWLGVTVILGGQTINWNVGLTMGYWEFFLSVAILGTAYFCLTFCIAEMASILPFAGGTYGYVRCSLGPTLGFLVGFAEAIEYIMYHGACVVMVGKIVGDLFYISNTYLPLLWLLFYAIALPLQIFGGPFTWRVAMGLGALTLCTVVTWCMLDIDHANITRYQDEMEVGGTVKGFLHYFSYAAWFFKGEFAILVLVCSWT
ncbi:hypothetical protein EON65_43315 [archaeon]|nr:MAG: hypothetical protein EON65_43315 [archaeon]